MNIRNKKGFTLIEVLAAVVIVGIIAAIALPRFLNVKTNAEKEGCKSNLASINLQIERYYTENGSWPTALADVTGDTDYFPDGAPTCPGGGTYTYSATTHRVTCDQSGHSL